MKPFDIELATTDELLEIIPSFINISSHIHEYTFGRLHITKDKGLWEISYKYKHIAVCVNYKDKESPYNNAIVYGNTCREALIEMYEWLIENKIITL